MIDELNDVIGNKGRGLSRGKKYEEKAESENKGNEMFASVLGRRKEKVIKSPIPPRPPGNETRSYPIRQASEEEDSGQAMLEQIQKGFKLRSVK